MFSKIRILPRNSQLCGNVVFFVCFFFFFCFFFFCFFFLKIRSKVKECHISVAGVSFEIQFSLFIKIWAGEHIFTYGRKLSP